MKINSTLGEKGQSSFNIGMKSDILIHFSYLQTILFDIVASFEVVNIYNLCFEARGKSWGKMTKYWKNQESL